MFSLRGQPVAYPRASAGHMSGHWSLMSARPLLGNAGQTDVRIRRSRGVGHESPSCAVPLANEGGKKVTPGKCPQAQPCHCGVRSTIYSL